jgi:HNH endonuclease
MPDQSASDDDLNKLVADARRASADRLRGYRARALELFPPVCAKCAREFSGKHVRELTVHHRDHNHDNNPLDGSNWELLCLYCHEQEHSRRDAARTGTDSAGDQRSPQATYQPFAGLEQLVKKTPDKS